MQILGGQLDISALLKAQKTFDAALKQVSNDLERDGAIQRFEYCLELSWKTLRRVLYTKGLDVQYPKDIFREAAKTGIVKDPEPWLQFVDARNKTAHLYKEEVAEALFAHMPSFQKELRHLIDHLKKL